MATTRKTNKRMASSTKATSKKTKKKTASAASKPTRGRKKTSRKVKRASTKSKAAGPPTAKTKKPSTSVKKKIAKKAKKKKPAKPKKSPVDPRLLKAIREALVSQRQQLLSVMQTTQAQMAEKEVGLADIIDRASGGFADELSLGLMRIEAAQIDDIEAAIARIDEGTYGLCIDCGKSIPRKRLEVLPFALRCLNCKGTRERKARILSRQDEEL